MPANDVPRLRAGMIGLGMIFDETYRPFFEQVRTEGLFRRDFGLVEVDLAALGSRTGSRAERFLRETGGAFSGCANLAGENVAADMANLDLDAVCVATPDDRHFEAARYALQSGKHVLIEKPSVLSLKELDELVALARRRGLLAKVVYHKLADPDHKKLRTHVADGVLRHVNNGYCSLLEPKQISGSQFAQWITGRNPGTYVAVHYIKLIDFTFGARHLPAGTEGERWHLVRVAANGQRGLVGSPHEATWDSVQLQMTYAYPDGREAAFDIHTSWVTPDNFPGYVEQEVQFRFDNAVWNAHQRKRGVEVAVENRTPLEMKNTPNHHYNGEFLEPWNRRSRRGYGIEIIRRFFEEVAYVELGGAAEGRNARLEEMRALAYDDLEADRNTVAVVQAMEAILLEHASGRPGCIVQVNGADGGLVLRRPGKGEPQVLHPDAV